MNFRLNFEDLDFALEKFIPVIKYLSINTTENKYHNTTKYRKQNYSIKDLKLDTEAIKNAIKDAINQNSNLNISNIEE